MDVTVIICTYNRSESLRRTLEKFRTLNLPDPLSWELLVTDNNSSDETRQVCREFQSCLPVRYLFEPQQGKTHALNRSIREATGGLLIFTDDDVDVDPDWMLRHWDAARRHPAVAFFSGKVIPRWEKTPPRWVEENSRTCLAGVTVSFDMGEAECPIVPGTCLGLGSNLALRRGILNQAGIRFRDDLGIFGGDKVGYEEIWLLQQLMANGFSGRYLPDAIVHHRNISERMTERYVRYYLKGVGVAYVRLGWITPSDHVWFGVPRYLWRQFLQSALFYGVTRFTRPSGVWVRHECKMAETWGSIGELRRTRREREGL